MIYDVRVKVEDAENFGILVCIRAPAIAIFQLLGTRFKTTQYLRTDDFDENNKNILFR
jgi:hypothetical protein